MPKSRSLPSLALAVVFVLALAACGPTTPPTASPGASRTPTPSAVATPGATGVAAELAAAAVLAADHRFVGFTPYNPTIPGQTRWYEMTADGAIWDVIVTVGWGDCTAACTHQHAWHYQVDRAGQAKLVDESGEGLPADVFPSPDNGIARYNLVTSLPGVAFQVTRFGGSPLAFQIVSGVDGKSHGSIPGGVYILSTVSRPDGGPLPPPFALSLAADADNLIAVALTPGSGTTP